MENIKREIYEMDAIDEKMAIAEQKRMEAQGKVQCKHCDSWEYEEDLTNELCEHCVDDLIKGASAEDVMAYASTLKEEDELALYTDYLFNDGLAVEILQKEVREACKIDNKIFSYGIREFIVNDTGHYIEYLERKGSI